MASTILESLRNIEAGRQNCIKNAKLANLDATEDMDIFTIGELFLEKNTPEYINPNDTWLRPEDWWDTKTILEEAEDRDNLHPAYILLFDDVYSTITFTKTTSGKALQFDGILTSDGEWYTADNSVHTWDTTQDKPCSEGYKTRYAIIYVADTTNINKIQLNLFPCLEFIAGNITLKNDGIIFGNSNESSANQNIRNIEYSDDTIHTTMSTARYASNCLALKRVSLPSITTVSGNDMFSNCFVLTTVSLPSLTTISYSNTFQNCVSLKHISLPNLEKVTNINTLNTCTRLESVDFPKLQEITNYNFLSGCSSLKTLYLPELVKINGDTNFQNCTSLTNVYFPKLIDFWGYGNFQNCPSLSDVQLPKVQTISGRYLFNRCYSLLEISLPSLREMKSSAYSTFIECRGLKTINIPIITQIVDYGTFNKCSNLQSISIPSTIQTLNTTDLFTGCINLYTITLFQGFKFSGLNLSTCVSLKHDSLNDILDNLADVTEESSTYTLTLGTDNLSKLTAQEIAVGTDKGWVIN